jgi:hypothetical protein
MSHLQTMGNTVLLAEYEGGTVTCTYNNDFSECEYNVSPVRTCSKTCSVAHTFRLFPRSGGQRSADFSDW